MLAVDQLARVRPGVRIAAVGNLPTVVVDLREDPSDAFARWVVDRGVELFAVLRGQLCEGEISPPRLCVILVHFKGTSAANQAPLEAACAAVRGAVLSLAVEQPQTLLTTVRVLHEDLGSLEDTIQFLAADDSSYITGSYLDLRSPP